MGERTRHEDRQAKLLTADGKKAKSAPNMRNRATRSRMRKGLAFEVRHDLYSALSKLEDMAAPTGTGRLFMGIEDWAAIGRKLAALSPAAFEKALAGARAHLDRLESVANEAPDFDKQETPPEAKKPPLRAISKTKVEPPKATATRAADELTWEKPAK